MKKIMMMVAVASLVMAGSCFAAEKFDINKACEDKAKLAAKIMDGRQDGFSMSEAMAIATKHKNIIMEQMIIEAYDTPRFSTGELVQSTISDFRDRWYGKCFKALSSVQK